MHIYIPLPNAHHICPLPIGTYSAHNITISLKYTLYSLCIPHTHPSQCTCTRMLCIQPSKVDDKHMLRELVHKHNAFSFS